MPRLPFIGRLLFSEYVALIVSLILVGLEVFIRIITLALPLPVLRFFYNGSASIFNRLTRPKGKVPRSKKKTVINQIRDASDFVDMCALFGYYAEEHIVQTGDGYLLGVHRLGWKKGEEGVRVNCGEDSVKKPVVYLHHGIMMNSEVWICITDQERCLPFQLVERGYDVWLGNNRGNKYSKKSTIHSPTDIPFWNFSMDQFAFHDIPDSIAYILSTTSRPSLSYIGFSQGTAQAFAALSIHPSLNEQVNLFIALAPAMSPAGLSNGIVDALIKASPDVIFLAFGRRSILSSATMWQAILYPPIFVRIIDMSLSFLFSWHSRNISPHQKLAAYPHLYSFTSTKSVVHWFQIIRTKSFQMYDDESAAILSYGAGAKYSKKHKFPTRNIKTPIMLMYGGSDSLVDISVMLKELPAHTIAKETPHYEHLDFLWGDDVDTLVFPHIFDALSMYADLIDPSLKSAARKGIEYHVTQPPSYLADNRINLNGGSPNTSSGETCDVDDSDTSKVQSKGVRFAKTHETIGTPPQPRRATHRDSQHQYSPPSSTSTASPTAPTQSKPESAPTPPESSWLSSLGLKKEKKSSSSGGGGSERPHSFHEGDLSIATATVPARSAAAGKKKRHSDGLGSPISFESQANTSGSSAAGGQKRPGFGVEGISLGRGTPVGGVVSKNQGVGVESVPGSESESGVKEIDQSRGKGKEKGK